MTPVQKVDQMTQTTQVAKEKSKAAGKSKNTEETKVPQQLSARQKEKSMLDTVRERLEKSSSDSIEDKIKFLLEMAKDFEGVVCLFQEKFGKLLQELLPRSKQEAKKPTRQNIDPKLNQFDLIAKLSSTMSRELEYEL